MNNTALLQLRCEALEKHFIHDPDGELNTPEAFARLDTFLQDLQTRGTERTQSND